MNTPSKSIRLLSLLLPLLAAGCLSAPEPTPTVQLPGDGRRVIVVNEGLWRSDAATLTLYNPVTGGTVQDWFAVSNPGLRLGDVANAVAVHGDRAYVVVSTSRTVEAINLADGRSLGRIHLDEPNELRAVAVLDSAHAYTVSFGDSLFMFNPQTFTVTGRVAVGPAPEGVEVVGGVVVVTNSGLGALRQGEPGAGTLYLFDPFTLQKQGEIVIGPNPRVVRADRTTGRLYVLYGLSEQEGGVVEVDVAKREIVRRWTVKDARDMALDPIRRRVYVVASAGVVRLPLDGGAPAVQIDTSAAGPGGFFYSIGVEPSTGDIYLGTTRGYQPVTGTAQVYSPDGVYRTMFYCGIYPGEFGFKE